MGLLSGAIKEKDKKDKKLTSAYGVSNAMFVPTGIDAIDYSLGGIEYDEKGNPIKNIGLGIGCIILSAGNSQAGKTTLLIQIADGMNQSLGGVGDIIDLDYEDGLKSPKSRVMNITGMSAEDYANDFHHIQKELMCVEDLKDWVLRIIEAKKGLKKEDMVQWKDLDNKPILIYPPTFIIVDSIPMLRIRELLEKEDMDNNMVAAQVAKVSNEVIQFLQPKLAKYNITILAANHLTTKIKASAYGAPKIQFPNLGDDEWLPGGNKWTFLPSFAFKLSSGAKLVKDKDYGVAGRKVTIVTLKTRTSFNDMKTTLILTARGGFDNNYTNLQALRDDKKLGGSGKGYFFKGGDPEMKFTLKNFASKLEDDAFYAAYREEIEKYWMEKLEERLGADPVDMPSDLNDEYEDDDDDNEED